MLKYFKLLMKTHAHTGRRTDKTHTHAHISLLLILKEKEEIQS
jgi:hypothetical protein